MMGMHGQGNSGQEPVDIPGHILRGIPSKLPFNKMLAQKNDRLSLPVESQSLNEIKNNSYKQKYSDRNTCVSASYRSDSGMFWRINNPLSLRTLWFCCLWVLLTTPSNICADSNGCDFFGSGLEQDGRGVQPVYLSCSSGRVEWQYPRAGLRVILKSPRKDKEFHGCIKGDVNFSGARIYLEGHRSLLPIFSADDGKPKKLARCFTSYKGQAALYVEAEPGTDNLKKQVAAFEYDLQIMSGDRYDPLEECRPCTEEELLRLYCSADFVAKGTIIKTEDDHQLSHTTITIKATKLFQQTSPVFRYTASSHKEVSPSSPESYQQNIISNLIDDGDAGYIGSVNVPIECQARSGEGEFIVMGVMQLGEPILKCAPRQDEWVKLAKKSHSRAQCVIET